MALVDRPVRGSRSGRPIMVLLDLLGRRWTLRVLWELRAEPLGFRALQARCDAMSPSVLNQRLAELAEHRLVQTDESGAYLLAPQGKELLALFEPVNRWAERWAGALREKR
jgi:DNA-binding HxlR family transcriptional regulator